MTKTYYVFVCVQYCYFSLSCGWYWSHCCYVEKNKKNKKTKQKKKNTAPSCFSVERELLAFRASHWTTESNGIVSVTFCHFLWRQAWQSWQLLIYNIISTKGHLFILDFRLLFVAFTYGSYSRSYSWWSPCWILLLSCKLVTPFSAGKPTQVRAITTNISATQVF